MHEWKYQEAAAERLSPGAVQRLRARFAAVMHGDGTVPSDGRRGGAGASRTQESGWLQSDKLESLWRAAVAESQPRYEGVLRERGSGNAPHVRPPQPRRRGSNGSDGDGDDGDDGGDGGGHGGHGGHGGDDSEGGVAEQPPTPFSEPRGSSTPFSEPRGSSTPFSEPRGSSTPFSEPRGSSTPFSEPRGSSTPFSEHAATDRELLAGWPGRLSKRACLKAG